MACVLFVDDDQELRELLSHHLKLQGHAVITASNGTDAVRMAKTESPDLAIIDMNLPKMTGWDVVRTIKGEDKTQGLPIIALSAHTTTGDKDEAHEVGCDVYLEKPVEIERLLEAVRLALA